MNFVKAEKISLRIHPELNEKWVQARIADDPAILGLGDLNLKDKERIQPRAGRLDILLQDDDKQRYEVEIQLGKTDEAHIIRTVEYWDIERRRYPQYDHTAVLIAEDITSRFLNVISLFNSSIPLIAIQMNAVKINDNDIALVFTTVMNVLTLGFVDEDEESFQPTDRAYWESKGTKATVAMADELFGIVKTLDPELELKYNKFYIGLARDGRPDNFATFRPQKSSLILDLKLQLSEDITSKLEAASIETLPYSPRWGNYRLRLTKAVIKDRCDLLRELLTLASGRSIGLP